MAHVRTMTAGVVTVLMLVAAAAQAGFLTTGEPAQPADPDIAAGQEIYANGAGGAVPACADCHGAAGRGDAANGYPAIGGMQPAYLKAQLGAFVSGARDNQTMDAIAHGLNDDEMSQVAAYISTLSVPTAADIALVADAGGADLVKRGRILFQYGKKLSRDDWVPACSLCHGKDAQGAGTQFPPLAGQHANYVTAQLQAWQKGERSNDPNGLMTTVAVKLSEDDVKAVAAYLATIANAEQPIWPYNPTEALK